MSIFSTTVNKANQGTVNTAHANEQAWNTTVQNAATENGNSTQKKADAEAQRIEKLLADHKIEEVIHILNTSSPELRKAIEAKLQKDGKYNEWVSQLANYQAKRVENWAASGDAGAIEKLLREAPDDVLNTIFEQLRKDGKLDEVMKTLTTNTAGGKRVGIDGKDGILTRLSKHLNGRQLVQVSQNFGGAYKGAINDFAQSVAQNTSVKVKLDFFKVIKDHDGFTDKGDVKVGAAILASLKGNSSATYEAINGLKKKDRDMLVQVDPSLKGVIEAAESESLTKYGLTPDDLNKLKTGTPAEQVEVITKLLKAGMSSAKVKEFLANSNLAGSAKRREALASIVDSIATLVDPKSSKLDKASAVFTIASKAGSLASEIFKPLKKYMGGIEAGDKFMSSVAKAFDPKASATERLRAIYDALATAKDMGVNLGELSKKLKALNNGKLATPFLKVVDDAIGIVEAWNTLHDPDKSTTDKIKAGKDLVTASLALLVDAKDSIGDLRSIKNVLATAGISSQELERLVPGFNQLDEAVGKAFSKLRNANAIHALLEGVSSLAGNVDKQKVLLDWIGAMPEGAADEILKGTIDGKRGIDVLTNLVDGLDGPAQKALTKLLEGFDSKAGQFLIKTLGAAAQEAGGLTVINKLLPLMAKGDTKLLSKLFNVFESVSSKLNWTPKTALKMLKGVGKAVPLGGAAMAAWDAYNLGKIAANEHNPWEIRLMAQAGMALNGADAVLSAIEPFIAEFGVPVLLDLGMAAVEVVVDILVSDQLAQYEANPKGYSAPGWFKALSLALGTAILGPGGMAGFGISALFN